MADRRAVWVFHAGALGDFVLIWPMLRALRRAGVEVTVVAAAEKGSLVATELHVRAVDAESRRFTQLWLGGGEPGEERGTIDGVARVLTFVADGTTEGGARWMAAAGAMFPGASVEHVGPPGSSSRAALWGELDVERLGVVEARVNTSGPVVVHIGAGSREKMWPMDRWREAVRTLRDGGGSDATPHSRAVTVLAGEVEAERLSADERNALGAMGGRVCTSLAELAEELRGASVVIGCDTGPTHLAAQLGVPTIALFGPTDPSLWAPVGPRVRVVAPASARGMAWLSAAEVAQIAAVELMRI